MFKPFLQLKWPIFDSLGCYGGGTGEAWGSVWQVRRSVFKYRYINISDSVPLFFVTSFLSVSCLSETSEVTHWGLELPQMQIFNRNVSNTVFCATVSFTVAELWCPTSQFGLNRSFYLNAVVIYTAKHNVLCPDVLRRWEFVILKKD